MKYLIFADIHIHKHKKSEDRLRNCLETLEWIFQVAEEKGIEHIIFGGDLFHDRQKIDVLTYQMAFEIFGTHKQAHIWLLLGNHDMYHKSKWEVSSAKPLSNLDHIHVIDEPKVQIIGKAPFAFLPFTENPIGDMRDLLQSKLFTIDGLTTQRKVLIGHLAVDGAILNTVHETRAEVAVEHDGDMVKVDKDSFKGWDHVFLGHYHAAQKLSKNVEYVGSPLQLSFGEVDQKKHIVIYDGQTGEREYVINEFSPRHLILGEKEADSGKHDLAGNFVRLMVDDLSASDILDRRSALLEERKVGTLEVQQKVKTEKDKAAVKDARAILFKEEDMIEKYVEDVMQIEGVGDLLPNKLEEIGKKILKEAKEKCET